MCIVFAILSHTRALGIDRTSICKPVVAVRQIDILKKKKCYKITKIMHCILKLIIRNMFKLLQHLYFVLVKVSPTLFIISGVTAVLNL